jgi:hypothetical protein
LGNFLYIDKPDVKAGKAVSKDIALRTGGKTI